MPMWPQWGPAAAQGFRVFLIGGGQRSLEQIWADRAAAGDCTLTGACSYWQGTRTTKLVYICC